jgi:hypothetical protein
MATPGYIAALEQDPYWQATAEDKTGSHVAIMRGHPDGQSERDYYLYGGDAYEASMAHSLHEVQELFSSRRLKLLRGAVPATEVSLKSGRL